jgi:hypothetical protein
MKSLVLVPLLSLALYGADVTGKWTGKIEVVDPSGENKISTPVKAEFQQKASAVSGKIGRAEDQEIETISNARIDDKRLSFEVQSAEATTPFKFSLVLVSEDRIEGEMKGAIDEGKISGKVVLQKVK